MSEEHVIVLHVTDTGTLCVITSARAQSVIFGVYTLSVTLGYASGGLFFQNCACLNGDVFLTAETSVLFLCPSHGS